MILGKLGAEYFRNQAKNMQIQKELIQRIGPALTKVGEKIIVTKGAALAKALYPDLGMRPMVDLDCLAAQGKIPLIKKALSSIGYSDGMDHIQLDWMGFQKHHIVLQSSNPALVPIELHFQLTSVNIEFFSININWFLEKIQPTFAEDCDQSIWTFTPSAHLLHLAIHLILQHSEGASQLKHFYDIHQILERWNKFIDWNELINVSQDMNLDYILWTAIKGCSDRFGTLLPPLFNQPPSGKRVRPLIKFVHFRKKQYPKTPVERYYRRLIGLPFGLQISGIFRFIFPKPDYMRFRYRI